MDNRANRLGPPRNATPKKSKGSRMKIRNLTKNATICKDALPADTFWRRTRGLMFRQQWNDFDGLILSPCGSIHTFWMRMAIDVCFISPDNRILSVAAELAPWRIAFGKKGSKTTLELPAGTLENTNTTAGDQLAFQTETKREN